MCSEIGAGSDYESLFDPCPDDVPADTELRCGPRHRVATVGVPVRERRHSLPVGGYAFDPVRTSCVCSQLSRPCEAASGTQASGVELPGNLIVVHTPVPGSISWADVAAFLVTAADSDRWVGKAVQIGG